MLDKDVIIAELRRVNAEQAAQIASLMSRVAELELQLAKARKDSSNSSKSPSSDLVKPPSKATRDRRKRPKLGGQPGHPRKVRELLPPERVDATVFHDIPADEVLARGLTVTEEFEIIQQFELPAVPVEVIEHHLRKSLDSAGNTVLPVVPGVTGRPIFGPNLLTMIGWLKSRAHGSYSTIAEWMEDVLQVPVSRGYLAKLCNGVISASLAEMHQELKQAIPTQPQVGSDESSLKNNGQRHWVWCITASLFTLFHITSSRSRAVLEELVGPDFEGFLHCDYYSANCSFAWNYNIKAQYCWAHLIRDLRFLLTLSDPAARNWADQLLDRTRRMFTAWHQRGAMTDIGFRRSMIYHRDCFLEIMDQPPDSRPAENLWRRFRVVDCEDESQYDKSEDYFRFMFEVNVEPTNNQSERQIRHCVIDRKITQGTRGAAGQRYHERMWTAIASCRQQQRSFFGFLRTSIESHLNGQPHPSLLPR